MDENISNAEKEESLVDEISNILKEIDHVDDAGDWIKEDNWDAEATKRSVHKIAENVNKMPPVEFTDEVGETKAIKGSFVFDPPAANEVIENQAESLAEVELLSMHKITTREMKKVGFST